MKRTLLSFAFYLFMLAGGMIMVLASPKDQTDGFWVACSIFVSLLGFIIFCVSLRGFTYTAILNGDLEEYFHLR